MALIKGCTGFAVHHMGVGGFGHKILSPADVFILLRLVLSSLLYDTLLRLYIRPPERCLNLTDTLSSIKAMLGRKIAHQTTSDV
jgi:hypothetical protein